MILAEDKIVEEVWSEIDTYPNIEFSNLGRIRFKDTNYEDGDYQYINWYRSHGYVNFNYLVEGYTIKCSVDLRLIPWAIFSE